MGKIEAQCFEHLLFRKVDGALIQFVSDDENGVRVTASIFVNDVIDVRVDMVIRRLT